MERDGGATGGYVLQPDASAGTNNAGPCRPRPPGATAVSKPIVFGVKVYITPAVGTSIVVADMRYIAVGVRDRWSVFYNPYQYASADQTAIRVTSRWAIARLHTEAVQIITTGVAATEGRDDSKPSATAAANERMRGEVADRLGVKK